MKRWFCDAMLGLLPVHYIEPRNPVIGWLISNSSAWQ